MYEKERLYGIKNVDTGMILSRNNAFTEDSNLWFKTNKHDALWLLEGFKIEGIYNVKVVEI